MEQLEITCPACGETVSFARRCRKCGAALDGLSEPMPKKSENALLQVALVSEILQDKQGPENVISDPLQTRLHAPRQYFLKVSDPSGQMPDKIIPVRAKGTLARWKITERESRTILSAYFYIHAEGHDIDTWIHYDLDTGQELGINAGDEFDPDPAAHFE